MLRRKRARLPPARRPVRDRGAPRRPLSAIATRPGGPACLTPPPGGPRAAIWRSCHRPSGTGSSLGTPDAWRAFELPHRRLLAPYSKAPSIVSPAIARRPSTRRSSDALWTHLRNLFCRTDAKPLLEAPCRPFCRTSAYKAAEMQQKIGPGQARRDSGLPGQARQGSGRAGQPRQDPACSAGPGGTRRGLEEPGGTRRDPAARRPCRTCGPSARTSRSNALLAVPRQV